METHLSHESQIKGPLFLSTHGLSQQLSRLLRPFLRGPLSRKALHYPVYALAAAVGIGWIAGWWVKHR